MLFEIWHISLTIAPVCFKQVIRESNKDTEHKKVHKVGINPEAACSRKVKTLQTPISRG